MTDRVRAGDDAEADAFAAFLAGEPGYAGTAAIDRLRQAEFSRLDRSGHVYVDYTGSGLYGESQVRRHADLLASGVFGNPHSVNPTSSASTEAVERCRHRVLSFFRADPREYGVAFTANASQALKLVGEAFPFEHGDTFLPTFDNHNSVNGIREFARSRGAETHYVPVFPPDLRGSDDALEEALARGGGTRHGLLAFPAQSNFSGVQHPLEWIDRGHAHGYDVLLDAAAFAPTNELDLSRWKPDFVTLSFYKMFGYPTGVGALLARHDALARLHRPWFAGGTIDVVSVQADQFRPAEGPAGFEDGTPNFLALPAVELGLDMMESVGVGVIHERVRALTSWLLDRAEGARASGRPAARPRLRPAAGRAPGRHHRVQPHRGRRVARGPRHRRRARRRRRHLAPDRLLLQSGRGRARLLPLARRDHHLPRTDAGPHDLRRVPPLHRPEGGRSRPRVVRDRQHLRRCVAPRPLPPALPRPLTERGVRGIHVSMPHPAPGAGR